MNDGADRAQAARALRDRAYRILAWTGLLQRLAKRFGTAVLTGSAAYDLMLWPDIDIHMPVDPSRRVEYAALAGKIAAWLPAAGLQLHRAQFLDDYVEPHPLGAGLNWGIEFRDPAGTPWKCDIWGWEPADFARRQERDRELRDALLAADRDLILRLKSEARERSNFYGVVVGSYDIYRFAIARAGTTLDELVAWTRSTASQPPVAAPTKPPGKLHRLTMADADPWIAMRRRLFPIDGVEVAREEVAAIVAKDSEAAFAVRDGATWLGFIELRERSHGEGCETSPVGYIEALWTEPEARRQGVARQLASGAIDWCRERGLSDLCSDTEINNVVSQAVHRRLGFEETEKLVAYRMKVPRG
jgi:ribosomal protein S18 acetylase RimI-like enzyme